MNANRNALRKTNPGEDGVDVSESLSSFAAISVGDPPADIFDVTGEGGSDSHKFNAYEIIFMDVGKLGFLAITSDPKRIAIHDKKLGLTGQGVITKSQVKIRYIYSTRFLLVDLIKFGHQHDTLLLVWIGTSNDRYKVIRLTWIIG